MNLAKMNPYIRVAMHSILPAGHRIPRRVIYDYELLYLEKGSFTLIYDDIPLSCKEGDLLLLFPGIPHSFALDHGSISQPHIHFDLTHRYESERIPVSFKDIPAMTAEEIGWIHPMDFDTDPSLPFLKIGDKRAFLNLFYETIADFEAHDPLFAKAKLLELLSMIVKANFPNLFEHPQTYSIPQQIKDYIDAGNGFQMKLDDFSKQFSYSKFHLDKKFKECFSVSLIEYRNQKRMEYAERLLKTLSVSETAEAVGFHSIYAFSRAYREHFDYPPSQEKNNIKKGKAIHSPLK